MASIRGSMDLSPRPFKGLWKGETKIVIGIDIGSTQSGVAFAFLQQGASQIIHRVTRWPGQDAQNQQSKIPSIIWYNSDKQAVSFGAEALSHQAEDDAEEHGWKLAKHFKLHLHPDDMKSEHDLKVEPLPAGISLQQIYSDFLGYLLRQTQVYFEDRILDGRKIWESYKPTMEVVIAHPNGWGFQEQAFLRSSAVEAGLTSAANALIKIRFVTEAEASVHFCIYHTNLGSRLQVGTNFLVCDAGGSTVDTTLYSVVSARPVLKLKEKRASACVQAGGIFVDAEMERYLRNALTNAQLPAEDVEEYTKAGVKDFEGFAKRTFQDTSTDYSITIAHRRFNNAAIRTRRGHMSLAGSIVQSVFSVYSKKITDSVSQQIGGSAVPYILLVGGFGDSPFLRQKFKDHYELRGCQVTLTNDSTSKAVADGAVIWATISSVFSRATRHSFGIELTSPFKSGSNEHHARPTYIHVDGSRRVRGVWGPVVSKGVVLDVEAVCRKPFCKKYASSTPDLEYFKISLISYSGSDRPSWVHDSQGRLLTNFRGVCVITANLRNLSGGLEAKFGARGTPYWHLGFNVCIRFGGTELEAYLEWEENGITRTGPVTIISEDSIGLGEGPTYDF